jgi:urease accessory protein
MLTTTERLARTRVRVSPGAAGQRTVVRTAVTLSDPTASSIRPVLVRHDRRGAQVSLVPDGALLLAADAIELDVTVDPGARLDLVEPAGTVAFDMRGGSAQWDVRIHVGASGTLTWAGEPFVVASGAQVCRRTRISMDLGARLLLRETLVLGRYGEPPGALRQRTRVDAAGPVLAEDLDLDAQTVPALLGPRRVVSSLLAYGMSLPPTVVTSPDPERFELEAGGLLWRRLGSEVHEARVDAVWHVARAALTGSDR